MYRRCVMEIIIRSLKAYIFVTCLFTALTFLLAALISFTGFKESWSFAGLVCILSVSSFVIGFMEGHITGKRGLFTGIAAAAVFMAMILLAVGGVFAGAFGIDSFSVFYLIPILAGAAGGIAGANTAG